jgi:ferredoxin
LFQSFLKQHDAPAWQRAIGALLPDMHELDRSANQFWCNILPLELAEAISESDDLAQLALTLRLEGEFNLASQIDSSHWFLYGHRYWPQVKAAIVGRADSHLAPSSLELTALIREIAKESGTTDESLLVGITAVGLMTLQQVGLPAFRAGSGAAQPPQGPMAKAPHHVVAARQRNDAQGLAGLFRGIRAKYTVTFDERRPDARFTLINQQHLTTASAGDRRDYSNTLRGTVEGPIPAQCRTASCGTCWVGILGGAERLSEVDGYERKRMKEFGYIDTPEPRPVIRLACQAVASGNVTLVIPPWNGFIGKRKGSRETSGAPPRR